MLRELVLASLALQALPSGRALAADDARLVDIVLDAKGFTPIDIYKDGGEVVPATWRGCKASDIMNKLKKAKPKLIVSEPHYQGAQQLYGYLMLGNTLSQRFSFALDVRAPDDMLMYFDFNRNGRLDDDGPPLKNEGHFNPGENGFATLLEIPWSDLAAAAPFEGKFKVWFILNSFQWANTGFTHASHTQLKGRIELGGLSYPIVISDQAANDNDADLTNDGLTLKLPGGKTRYISDKEAKAGAVIDGRRYIFRIRYPKIPAPRP